MRLRKRLFRSGNSFAVRLTTREAASLALGAGDAVDIDVQPASGLQLDPGSFFRDGRGSMEHDEDIARGIAHR